MIEIAAGQQEGEQHQGSVEIGVFGVVNRFRHRHRERQHDADADRHIHVGVARPQGAQSGLEERLPRIGSGRQGNQRRQPVEEIALLRDHVADIAGPHRDRQHHDVHRGKGGDAETAQQKARLLGLHRFGADRLERIGLVAELCQAVDETGRVERALLPFQRHAAVGQVDTRQRHIRKRGKTALDLRHATGAIDALDRQIDMRQPRSEMPDIM